MFHSFASAVPARPEMADVPGGFHAPIPADSLHQARVHRGLLTGVVGHAPGGEDAVSLGDLYRGART